MLELSNIFDMASLRRAASTITHKNSPMSAR